MHNRLFRITLLLLVGFCVAAPAQAVMNQRAVAAGAYDGILVKFKAGVSQTRMNRAFSSAGSRQHRGFRSRLVRGLTRAQIGRGYTLSSTLRRLRNNRDVEFAEPNYLLSAYVLPSDPQFGSLWGLHNTGQTGGVADADIDAPEAWDLQTGGSVIVAVVDSGVDYNHADLAGNIWSNTAEIPNNGRDDDGNGYVDDVRGWDFANNDNDPMDDNNHGTHVSGTIAGRGNNGTGVVGVNWSARIMPLKFMDSTGVGSSADAIAAIDYAVANGARVINASWGGGNFSAAMQAAISAANNAGVLFVAAAGNSSNNNDNAPSYPADYNLPNVISVAATDDADTLAGFSNFGANSVDLGAPGVRILSTVPGNAYASFNGTSMAAPHVTGVAALVIASNPGIGIPALRAALLDNVDPVADLAGRTVTGGRLNAFKALGGGATPPPPPPPAVVSVTPGNTSVVLGGNVQFTATGGSAPYVWSVANPTIGSISANGVFTGLGLGSTSVNATDANGVRSNSATVSVSATTVILISPNSAQLRVGESLTFTASGGAAPYTWTSNSPGVASIDSNTGVLTAQAAGATTITVTDSAGAFVNSGPITVTAPPPVTIVVTPTSGSVAVGSTLSFSATGGRAPYTWQVSNSAVASIDGNGVLTGLAAGSVTVTARDANGATGVSGSITVTAAAGGGRRHGGRHGGGMMGRGR